MPSLEIIKPGTMTSIQDLGRKGLAYYAIPVSGVMDKNSAQAALLLLNQDEDSPLIECTSIAPKIRFNDPVQVAITGADFSWKINDEVAARNVVIDLKKGDTLHGKFAKDGLRAYIGINGMWKIEKIYNSYSTYINAGIGGLAGRLLKSGDVISWTRSQRSSGLSALKISSLNQRIIPIKKGPEFGFLTRAAQDQLNTNTYKVGPDSNRMGARLQGPKLESCSYQLEHSLPVLPGFIQLPPSGWPIVILQDGQISGGYPRIAYIREKDLSALNQIPLGVGFRFALS